MERLSTDKAKKLAAELANLAKDEGKRDTPYFKEQLEKLSQHWQQEEAALEAASKGPRLGKHKAALKQLLPRNQRALGQLVSTEHADTRAHVDLAVAALQRENEELKRDTAELKRGVAKLLEGQEAEKEERAKKKAKKDARLFEELFGDEAAGPPEGEALAQEPVAQLAPKRRRAAPAATGCGHSSPAAPPAASAESAAPAPKGGYTRWPVARLRETLENLGEDSTGAKATLVARLKKLEADCGLARATSPKRAAPAASGPLAAPAEERAKATKRLAAFVHACGADLAQKLHGEAARLAPFEGVEDFERDRAWQHHQRLEVNTRLDGVSRDLAYAARADADPVKLQKAWLTRLLLNKRGALAAVEQAYRAKVGRSLYEGACDEAAFAEALAATKLDNACSRMRRVQWHLEAKAQGKAGEEDQRQFCAALWARLRRDGAFGVALARLAEGAALAEVLRDTLAVHSKFLAMLVARDLAVLLPKLVKQSAVDACTVVGGGAEDTLVACTKGPQDRTSAGSYSAACKKTFPERLKHLHGELVKLLDPALLALVVPQGWTLDLTENACCELRRWDRARTHRKRNFAERAARQQQRLQEVSATWRQLGFASPPALVA